MYANIIMVSLNPLTAIHHSRTDVDVGVILIVREYSRLTDDGGRSHYLTLSQLLLQPRKICAIGISIETGPVVSKRIRIRGDSGSC